MRVNDNLFLGYEERIRFDFGKNSTGKVIFAQDPDDEESIGTFLKFERGMPIMEYSVTLDQGRFRDVEGRDIQILGHTYQIAEVTNTSVVLFGKTIPSTLLFENGTKLRVNGTKVTETEAFVYMGIMGFRLYADDSEDDMLLSPGESLADRIGQDKFASQLLNIRYLGAPSQNATLVTFKRTDYGYKMIVDTFAGRRDIPLVHLRQGNLVLGEPDTPLRVTPCPARQPFCIAPETMLLLTRRDQSFIVEYRSLNDEAKTITFRDTIGNKYTYDYLGNDSRNQAFTDVLLSEIAFRVRIGAKDNTTGTHNISIDQGFMNGRAELNILGGFTVRIENATGYTLPIKLIVPPINPGERIETTLINITYDPVAGDWYITNNMTFVEDEDTHDSFAVTPYGLSILLDKDERNLPINRGNEAIILIPRTRTYGMVKIEG